MLQSTLACCDLCLLSSRLKLTRKELTSHCWPAVPCVQGNGHLLHSHFAPGDEQPNLRGFLGSSPAKHQGPL